MNKNHTGFIVLILGLLIATLIISLKSIDLASGNALTPGDASLSPTSGITPVPFAQLNTPQKIEAARIAGKLSPDEAALFLAYALRDYQKLPAEYLSNVPWDGTLPLLQLRQTLKTAALQSQTVSIIEALLSNTCDVNSAPLPNTISSNHFYIEYDIIRGDLTIADYVVSLESAWTIEVTQFAWAAPPVKISNPPPGNKYHVRIESLGSSLYGFVSSQGTFAGLVLDNPNTSWYEGDAYASCMVLNNDYSSFPGISQAAMDATTAHEFNHSIQYGLGALSGLNVPDPDFIEGGATWMEDEVFDNANDNYYYLWPQFNQCMGEYTFSPYPYWITLRGMVEQYGTGIPGGSEDVMQAFWELTSQNAASNLNAMDQALTSKGTSLAAAYHNYAIAVRFRKACVGSIAYPYCLEEGPNYPPLPIFMNGSINHGNIIDINGSYSGSLQDNYALNWIGLPNSGNPYDVTLSNTASGGHLRGSVVCDTGTTLSITPLPAIVGASQSTILYNYNPAGCSSIVLVLTNQSQTAADPGSCATRNYKVLTGPGSTPGSTPTPTFPPLTGKYFYYFPFVQISN
jgi:hypothetical protein